MLSSGHQLFLIKGKTFSPHFPVAKAFVVGLSQAGWSVRRIEKRLGELEFVPVGNNSIFRNRRSGLYRERWPPGAGGSAIG